MSSTSLRVVVALTRRAVVGDVVQRDVHGRRTRAVGRRVATDAAAEAIAAVNTGAVGRLVVAVTAADDVVASLGLQVIVAAEPADDVLALATEELLGPSLPTSTPFAMPPKRFSMSVRMLSCSPASPSSATPSTSRTAVEPTDRAGCQTRPRAPASRPTLNLIEPTGRLTRPNEAVIGRADVRAVS
jgi:hypothetical protein